ncbi:integrin alpha-PS2 isoform X2 [Cherax quadricarinatus]
MYSPCMTPSWGYHRQGSCQAGISTTLTQNGNRLYVGAVGSYYWQGQVFYQNLLNRQEALATGEGPKVDDMSYLGYSAASGDFTGDGVDDLVVGMPRGNDLTGQVVVLEERLTILYNISGDQVGSYFGYSVAVVDSDGDQLMDIAVGAPWYTDPHSSSDYEVGMVALYLQTPQHNFQRSTRLTGVKSRSHFGLALTSLGDIDRDGYQDLAVGAPMDGPKGQGGVYIYLGSPEGLSSKPSQVLLGEEMSRGGAPTFGWSLAGGEDLDGNEYPDLLVGAYDANSVFVLRARPVVHTHASLKFKSESGIVDLEVLRCSLQDRTEVPCVSLQYCLKYTGHRVPSTLKMEVWLQVDTKAELAPRMFFLQREGHTLHNLTLELRKSVEHCATIYTYLTRDPGDKLTPLVAEMSSSLLQQDTLLLLLPEDDQEVMYPHEAAAAAAAARDTLPRQRRRRGLRPILAPSGAGAALPTATIYIKNNCGGDNICVPDLVIDLNMDAAEYVLGSPRDLLAQVTVRNTGEDAFLAKLQVKVPRGATFSRFLLQENTASDVTPICSAVTKTSSEEVICDVGNPLPSEALVVLQLVFQPTPHLLNTSSLDFHITASSANPEDPATTLDNHAALALPVTVRSDINIKGISIPDEPFDYNASMYGIGLVGDHGQLTHERQVGPEVMHVYDITNRGPSDLPAAYIILLWPSRTLSQDPLLYMLETPMVSSPAVCHSLPHINYLGLEVDKASHHLPDTSDSTSGPGGISRTGSTSPRLPEDSGEVLNDQAEGLHRRRHDRHHQRGRRSDLDLEGLEEELSCGPTNCTRMVCSVAPLAASHSVVIRVRSRLWVDTLRKVGMPQVKISSRVMVAAARGSTSGTGEEWWHQSDATTSDHQTAEDNSSSRRGLWSRTVTTVVRTGPEEQRSSLKWVVVVGSILAGLLLLALLSTLLWAMGFFKRQRPHDKTETEPLNTNGYYGNGTS